MGYTLLLLAIILYLFGIVGFHLFGRNDPGHFGSVSASMVSLFQMSTFSSWADVMYLNYHGCDKYAGFTSPGEREFSIRTGSGSFPGFVCHDPKARAMASPLFFFCFVAISSFIVLSLFVGVITMGINEAMAVVSSPRPPSTPHRTYDCLGVLHSYIAHATPGKEGASSIRAASLACLRLLVWLCLAHVFSTVEARDPEAKSPSAAHSSSQATATVLHFHENGRVRGR